MDFEVGELPRTLLECWFDETCRSSPFFFFMLLLILIITVLLSR